jgi:hypothetical protein
MTNSPRLIFSYPNLASVQNYVLRLKHSTKANKKIFAQNKQKKIFEQNKQKNIRTKQTKKYSNKTNKKIFEQNKQKNIRTKKNIWSWQGLAIPNTV